MVKHKCQCCGIEKEFKDEDEAFKAGWDTPQRFGYTTCDLCPGVCITMGASHKKAHALWAKEGRPTEFTITCCGVDEYMK